MRGLPITNSRLSRHSVACKANCRRKIILTPFYPRYAELAVTSNFTFLRGASHPDELVRQAGRLGYAAVAVADWNSLAGVVRGHVAAKEAGVPLVVGCRLVFSDPDRLSVIVFPTDRAAYGRLCRLLTLGKRRAAKGECHLTIEDLLEYQEGLLGVVMGLAVDDWLLNDEPWSYEATEPRRDGETKKRESGGTEGAEKVLRVLREAFNDDRLSLAVARLYGPKDGEYVGRLTELSHDLGIPLVAVNDVYYHVPERRVLQDVLTCVRYGCTLCEAGFRLFPNGERHLKPPTEMARLFADRPEALARGVEIAGRALAFNLDQLRYEYPDETCPAGASPMEHLKALVREGAKERYPQVVPDKVRRQIEHEFGLIEELNYAPYFLTVHDLVKFARSRGILCQGRGAAANSAVCFCLGVTSVDPERIDVLFERFVSRERNEPPDIDIDFEHERREEVIQYIYGKYGRERAGLTAEVITYRRRSAIRDVGKAMGFSPDAVDRIAKRVDTWEKNPFADSESGDVPAQLAALGYDSRNTTVRQFVELVREVIGFPRHLSQHVGGLVMTRGLLCELVPIENAAMPDRTVIEWDKDDIEALGMLKVDVLGLGILSAIRKCLEWINGYERREGEKDGWREDIANESLAPRAGSLIRKRLSQKAVPISPRGLKPAARLNIGMDSKSGRDSGWNGESREACTPCLGALVPSCLRACLRTPSPFKGEGWGEGETSKGPRVFPLTQPSPPRGRGLFKHALSLATIPAEDPAIYEMIERADTLGVFQIESRAQMTMLPRLRPKCFYDLVIEVAIVRPGPIVGEMVHPYLRRRNGEEAVEYPSEVIREVLGKTLGVPLFQEQVMALAIKAAGFTAGEAEKLRRAITAWTAKEDIARFPEKFVEGMIGNGYERAFAEWCFQRFKGFSQYGFPESHAASFALLVYASAWLKRYYPAAYAASLLNSQPMGFYAPAQIVRDARDHGVEVRGVDVNWSAWDCTLEAMEGESHEATEPRSRGGKGDEKHEGTARASPAAPGTKVRRYEGAEERNCRLPIDNCPVTTSLNPPRKSGEAGGRAMRLGMRMVRGLREDEGRAVVEAVGRCGRFGSVVDLWRASGVAAGSLRALARADAFGSMGLNRQQALWEVQKLKGRALPLLDGVAEKDSPGELPVIPPLEEVTRDYCTVGLSLKAHPLSFLREELSKMGVWTAATVKDVGSGSAGRWVKVAGMVLFRQRPGTARGVMFMTIEDETGRADLIVRPPIYERYRNAAVYGNIVLAGGRIERQGRVVHVLADRLEDIEPMADKLPKLSRDFR